jgi:ABC-type polysaccharide/polyol phosphate transport system ATPase subunit
MEPVITFSHVSKKYRSRARGGLRQAFAELGKRLVGHKAGAEDKDVFWALRDLSFDVPAGSALGVIGPNGAGKTTTLRLLARIAHPTTGSIDVRGRVCALIELGAGFHPELTGRENVFLNGTILGMRRQEIELRFDQIVDFAQLTDFIDTPVKYYSSGMYARLGFAVAAHTNPDVLVVDEVLAVGDYAFQQRCYQRMKELRDQGTTVLLVSHNLAAITDACDHVIVLNHGRAVFQGPTPQAVARYADLIRETSVTRDGLAVGRDGIGERIMTHGARVRTVTLVDEQGQPVDVIRPGSNVRLIADVDFLEDAPSPHFSCFVRDERGQLVYDQTTLWQGRATPSFADGERATVVYDLCMNVTPGVYQIGMDLHYQDLRCYYDRLEHAASIVVSGGDGAKGVADLRWRVSFDARAARAPGLVAASV